MRHMFRKTNVSLSDGHLLFAITLAKLRLLIACIHCEGCFQILPLHPVNPPTLHPRHPVASWIDPKCAPACAHEALQ